MGPPAIEGWIIRAGCRGWVSVFSFRFSDDVIPAKAGIFFFLGLDCWLSLGCVKAPGNGGFSHPWLKTALRYSPDAGRQQLAHPCAQTVWLFPASGSVPRRHRRGPESRALPARLLIGPSNKEPVGHVDVLLSRSTTLPLRLRREGAGGGCCTTPKIQSSQIANFRKRQLSKQFLDRYHKQEKANDARASTPQKTEPLGRKATSALKAHPCRRSQQLHRSRKTHQGGSNRRTTCASTTSRKNAFRNGTTIEQ